MSKALDNLVLLPAHSNMTPDEALAYCSKEEWDDVLIIGYAKNELGVFARSSKMTRAEALWLLEFAKLQVMKLDE